LTLLPVISQTAGVRPPTYAGRRFGSSEGWPFLGGGRAEPPFSQVVDKASGPPRARPNLTRPSLCGAEP